MCEPAEQTSGQRHPERHPGHLPEGDQQRQLLVSRVIDQLYVQQGSKSESVLKDVSECRPAVESTALHSNPVDSVQCLTRVTLVP